jgi:formylglycine-generating enzyme required for sulfatase activity
MVLVPAGDFVFGDDSPDSPRPRQMRTNKAFYIDKTEVSNAEYKRFVDATGHVPPQSTVFLTRPDLPVVAVSFDDAEAYAKWAHKRLPSEEEWEKAARGTDGRRYPWGNAPWTSDVPTELQSVDSFVDRKSPYGALNMAGNVAEWTTGPFLAGEREIAELRHKLGNREFSKIWYSIKGGSFPYGGDIFFACFMHWGLPSDQHSMFIGFRCARDLPETGLRTRLQSMFSK